MSKSNKTRSLNWSTPIWITNLLWRWIFCRIFSWCYKGVGIIVIKELWSDRQANTSSTFGRHLGISEPLHQMVGGGLTKRITGCVETPVMSRASKMADCRWLSRIIVLFSEIIVQYKPNIMGLLTILKKMKQKEKEMRILMLYPFVVFSNAFWKWNMSLIQSSL